MEKVSVHNTRETGNIYTLVGSLEVNPLAVKLLNNRLYISTKLSGYTVYLLPHNLYSVSKRAFVSLAPFFF